MLLELHISVITIVAMNSHELTPEQLQDIKNSLIQGKKIFAIKKYRSYTRSDLLRAKNFVDDLQAEVKHEDKKHKKYNRQPAPKNNSFRFSPRHLQMMTELTQKGKKDDAIAMYMRLKYNDNYKKSCFVEAREFIAELPSLAASRLDFDKEDAKNTNATPSSLPLEANEPRFQNLQWIPAKHAPKFIKNYIDNSIPLMETQRFVAQKNIPLPLLVFALLLCLGLALFAYRQILFNDYFQSQVHASQMVIFVASSLAALVFGLLSYLLFKKRHKTAQLLQQNKYREGLFVLNKALLLHKASNYCYIPSKAIVQFKLTQNKSDLIIQCNKHGEDLTFRLGFLATNFKKLHQSLTNWQKSNIWVPPSTQNSHRPNA